MVVWYDSSQFNKGVWVWVCLSIEYKNAMQLAKYKENTIIFIQLILSIWIFRVCWVFINNWAVIQRHHSCEWVVKIIMLMLAVDARMCNTYVLSLYVCTQMTPFRRRRHILWTFDCRVLPCSADKCSIGHRKLFTSHCRMFQVLCTALYWSDFKFGFHWKFSKRVVCLHQFRQLLTCVASLTCWCHDVTLYSIPYSLWYCIVVSRRVFYVSHNHDFECSWRNNGSFVQFHVINSASQHET